MISLGFVIYDAAEIWHLSSLMRINQPLGKDENEVDTNQQDSMVHLRQGDDSTAEMTADSGDKNPDSKEGKELHHVRMINKLIEN